MKAIAAKGLNQLFMKSIAATRHNQQIMKPKEHKSISSFKEKEIKSIYNLCILK